MENDEEGIKKTSQAAPLYDPFRMELFVNYVKAARLASKIRSYYNIQGRTRRLSEEDDLHESVRYLWALLRTKITSLTGSKNSYYAPLLALDDLKHNPTTAELLTDANLLRDYLEDFGLFAVENNGLAFSSGVQFAKGFNQKKRRY